MDKLRQFLNSGSDKESQAEEGGMTEIVDSNRFGLSYSTRLKGFIGCFVGGFLLSLLGTVFIFIKLNTFVVFYTLGSILGIGR